MTYGQTIPYSTTVHSTSQSYSVTIEIVLTDILPIQNNCDWGYNYDVAYDYNVEFIGNDTPASLYTLAGDLTCGANQGIYFNLPTSEGSGTATTQGNPWNNNSDCSTATVESLACHAITLQIEGPGIPSQSITLEPNDSDDNGNGWNTDGNDADSTHFIGTTNSNPLVIRTNNEERMRITEDGNVGIGTLNPVERLQVNGRARIDSTLIVKDSIFVKKSARIDGDLNVQGGITLHDGVLNLKPLIDTSLSENGLLMIKNNGDVINGGELLGLIYEQDPVVVMECLTDLDGNIIYSPPAWQHDPQRMFILNSKCKPDVKLGVGVKPEAKLHVKTNNNSTYPLLIEKTIGETAYKLLQLNNNGLLQAREVIVDEQNWPDYVFKDDYNLMPLNEVKTFIEENGHLPNVPSAIEVEANGVNLGDAAKISMEKVEELTLYLIEINGKLETQNEELEKQADLIKIQQETIQLQQQLIEELKNNKKQ